MNRHLDIKITGLVQGVFFRHTALRKAQEFGIEGYAKNEADGSVLIEAEGPEEALEMFAAWCRQGPPSAEVKGVEVVEGAFENYTGFTIA